MAKTKHINYRSSSFQDRIEVSLANISRSSGDKFSVLSMKYIPKTFKCELCGHEPCLYAFTVKNHETGKIIDVGSECVNHFKGECDIDVAEGLKKRIKSVTRKMRRYMKKSVSQEDYKEMDKDKKRELTVKLFMAFQTKEMLKEGAKKTRLTKEEVNKILLENAD